MPKEEKGRGRCLDVHADLPRFQAPDRLPVGNRDSENALAFMDDLAARVEGRIQLTTDPHPMYPMVVELAFGWNRVDYPTGSKRTSPEAARRYSPPVCTGVRKKAVMGGLDPDMVSTSHIERNNLTMRTGMRRFTRLTNAFSKKLAFPLYAVALHTMSCNHWGVHTTLTKERGELKTTPVMAAGPTDRLWTVNDLLS